MASLLNWLGKEASGVYHQINPFDNGQTYSTVVNNRPPVRYQPQQQGGLQVRPVQQAPLAPIVPNFHVATAPLQVHVAPPQSLNVGNQIIQPTPQAHTAPIPNAPPPSYAPQPNDVAGLRKAYLNLGAYGQQDQARIVNRASMAGIVPHNVAAALQNQILSPTLSTDRSKLGVLAQATEQTLLPGSSIFKQVGNTLGTNALYNKAQAGKLNPSIAQSITAEANSNNGNIANQYGGINPKQLAGAGINEGIKAASLGMGGALAKGGNSLPVIAKSALKTGTKFGVAGGVSQSLAQDNLSPANVAGNILKNTAQSTAMMALPGVGKALSDGRVPLNAVGAVGKNVSGVGGESDPVIKAIANENKFKDQIQAMRQQAPNDNHFYENTILNNVEKPGDVGNFARHVARRVEGGGENPTNVLNDALQKTDLKAEAAAQQSAHVQELKSMVSNLEKSTGQKGLYSSVLKNMAGMNEKQQLDYLGKSLTSMRDNGVLAMDHLNKENGFTPQTNKPPIPVSAVDKNVNGMPKDFLKQDPKIIAQNARILQTSKAKAAAALDKTVLPENKAVVNQRLSKMPAIPEIPDTSAVPGQELQPTQNLPVIQKLFANKVTALRQVNTPSSHTAADKMVAAEAGRQAMQAQWMHSIPTVRSLNKNEFGNFVDTVEKNAKAQNPKVAQAVKEWQTLTPQIAKTGQSQGFLLNGERQNYFPHQYDVIKEGSTKWDNQIQGLMDTRKINHETAVNILKSHNDNVKAGFVGSLENSRETTLPGYHKDIHAVNSYIGRAASRVADAQHFGNDAQVANKLVENIRIEGGDANAAEAALRNYLTNPDKGGTGSKTLAGARGAFGAASLSKAPISHMGQTSNVAVEAGVKNTLKGWGQFLSHNSEAKDFVDKTGVTNPQELHSYRNQFTSVKGGISKVTAYGLTPVMKVNRSVTALAGRAFGNHLAGIGDTAKLEQLGVTGKIGKTLTATQEVQAARGLSNHTMFSGSRSTTPTYAETPIGKTVGQFRTAYAYKQTGFIYNQVIKEASKGNLAPLARYLGISAGLGATTVSAKNKISGNKEGVGGVAMDTLGALGGIPGELAVQAARYGSRAGNLTKTVAGAVAPLAGEAMTLGSNLDSLLHGKPAPLERTALKAIPLVGNRVSNALLPPKTGPNASKTATSSGAAPNNTTTTLNAKGKTVKMTQRELKGNNPDELTRWQGMTNKARENVKLNNPDKYIRDQGLKVQQEQSQGNTTAAFKDQRLITQTQVSKNFDKNIVGAYGLNATDFKAFVAQATPDQLNQLHNLDNQLVDKGLVAKSKFPKPKAAKKARGFAGSGSAKFTIPKVSGAKAFRPPKGVKIKVAKAFKAPKTQKIAVSKIPNVNKKKLG